VAGIGANARFGSERAISGSLLARVVRAEVVVIAGHRLGTALTIRDVANLRSAKSAAWASNRRVGANAGVADVVGTQVSVRAVLGGVGAAVHNITHSWEAKIGGSADVCFMGAVGSSVGVHVARVISARIVVVTGNGGRRAGTTAAGIGAALVVPSASFIIASHTHWVPVVDAGAVNSARVSGARVRIITALISDLTGRSFSALSDRACVGGSARDGIQFTLSSCRIAGVAVALGASSANNSGVSTALVGIASGREAQVGRGAGYVVVVAHSGTWP
jgi:hypothetical protein